MAPHRTLQSGQARRQPRQRRHRLGATTQRRTRAQTRLQSAAAAAAAAATAATTAHVDAAADTALLPIDDDDDNTYVARYRIRHLVQAAAMTASIVTLVIMGLQVLVASTTSLLDLLFVPSSPSANSLQPVDWFHEAARIDISLASIPRVVIFGETSQEEPQWKCQPELRPDGGRVHFPNHDEAAVKWPFDSGFHPTYKPWETSSNGTYIPEFDFVLDIYWVVDTVAVELDMIARFGPPSFRFTQGTSAQSTWSTSGDESLPPNDSLPTIPYEEGLLDAKELAVYGMPPTSADRDQSLSPTDRPKLTLEAYLSNPGFEFSQQGAENIIDIMCMYAKTFRALYFSPGYEARLVEFYLKHFLKPQQQATPMMTDTSPGKKEPGDVPEDISWQFLALAFGARLQRVSRTGASESSSSSNPSPSSSRVLCRPSSRMPRPEEWRGSQARNRTAHELVDVLNHWIEGSIFNISEGGWSKFLTYATKLTKLRHYVEDVIDRVDQLRRATSEVRFDDRRSIPKLMDIIRDASGFLTDIVLPRVRDMERRAARGVERLIEADKDLHALQDEIERLVSAGWVQPHGSGRSSTMLHFPSMEDIIADWELAGEWMDAEVDSVEHGRWARDQPFRERRWRRYYKSKESEKQPGPIIASRWNMRDARSDPEGSEAFCWSHGPKPPNDIGCGNASRRHG